MSKLKYNLCRYIRFLCLYKCCVHKIFTILYIYVIKINECYRKSIWDVRYKDYVKDVRSCKEM